MELPLSRAQAIICSFSLFSIPAFGADLAPGVDRGIHTPMAQDESNRVELGYEKRSRMSLDPEQDSEMRTGAIETTSAGARIGMSPSMELHLSLRGISTESKTVGHSAAFGGGTIGLRKGFLMNQQFQLELGLFLESGTSGGDAPESIGRSHRNKYGMTSHVRHKLGTLTTDIGAGITAREAEEFQSIMIGNEAFYTAGAQWALSKTLRPFVRANGRSIRLKGVPANAREFKYYSYKEGLIGLNAQFDSFGISIYGGGSLGDASFGYGKKTVGMSFQWTVGSSKERAEPKLAKKRSHGEDIIHDVETLPDVPKPKKPIGTVMDDFQLIEERLKKSGLRESLKSEDEYADSEIERLRQVEQKKKELEQRQQARQESLRQKALREQIRLDNETEADLIDDVKDELDELPNVTDEDLDWKGLED